ncbi:MAG TPA: hypothetical protein VFU72_12240 [Nitrolancea sp.]|nr:hypothetical protein [Nitrolancea sp.]
MAKTRLAIYLDTATAEALASWQLRHRESCPSLSEAGQWLLARALLADLNPGAESLIAPYLERRLTAAIGGLVREELSSLLRAQTDRLAALLVRSGKDARTSARLATAILEQLTGDHAFARRLAEEARLAAGPAYTAQGLRATGED